MQINPEGMYIGLIVLTFLFIGLLWQYLEGRKNRKIGVSLS